MNIQEFKTFINDYVKENPDCWIGLHDTHTVGLSQKIENVGLNVSHSPYGKKSRHLRDENGKIDVSKNFKATMFHLSGENEATLFAVPKDPVVINIPTVFLDIYGYSATNSSAFQDMCLYGIEQPPIPNEDGFGFRNGDSVVVANPEEATVRILPTYFIAGHIDMQSGEFIENPKHFSNLSEEEKEEILSINKELSTCVVEEESESE